MVVTSQLRCEVTTAEYFEILDKLKG